MQINAIGRAAEALALIADHAAERVASFEHVGPRIDLLVLLLVGELAILVARALEDRVPHDHRGPVAESALAIRLELVRIAVDVEEDFLQDIVRVEREVELAQTRADGRQEELVVELVEQAKRRGTPGHAEDLPSASWRSRRAASRRPAGLRPVPAPRPPPARSPEHASARASPDPRTRERARAGARSGRARGWGEPNEEPSFASPWHRWGPTRDDVTK
jgi:hypothetical protein